MLTELSKGISYYVWLGASDEKREGYWYWTNDEMFSYLNWYPGEPNNTNGTEHYLLLGVSGNVKGKWNDGANDIDTVNGFICEYEPEIKITIGDLNGDNSVDVLDATLIQKYAVDKAELTDEQVASADVNNDNVVDILDATEIQKFSVDKITGFKRQTV